MQKKISKNKIILLFMPVANFALFFLWFASYVTYSFFGIKAILRRVAVISFIILTSILIIALIISLYEIFEIQYVINNGIIVGLINMSIFYIWGLFIGGMCIIDEFLLSKKQSKQKEKDEIKSK